MSKTALTFRSYAELSGLSRVGSRARGACCLHRESCCRFENCCPAKQSEQATNQSVSSSAVEVTGSITTITVTSFPACVTICSYIERLFQTSRFGLAHVSLRAPVPSRQDKGIDTITHIHPVSPRTTWVLKAVEAPRSSHANVITVTQQCIQDLTRDVPVCGVVRLPDTRADPLCSLYLSHRVSQVPIKHTQYTRRVNQHVDGDAMCTIDTVLGGLLGTDPGNLTRTNATRMSFLDEGMTILVM